MKSRAAKIPQDTKKRPRPAGAPPAARLSRGYDPALLLGIAMVFVLGAALRIIHAGDVQSRTPDEKVYTLYANTMLQQGPAATQALVRDVQAKKDWWVYPPPTRIGFLWPLAAVMQVTGNTDERAGGYLSCLFSIASLVVVIGIGLRFLTPWITLFALMFMAVFPAELALSRRAWQDSMVGCLGLLTLWLACEAARRAGSLRWCAAFVAAGSYSLLVKESAVLVYGVCALWLFGIQVLKLRSWRNGIVFAGIAAAGAAASLWCLATASGGLAVLATVLRHVQESIPTNPWVLQHTITARYRVLEGFWVLSPPVTVLCAVGLVVALLPHRLRPELDAGPLAAIALVPVALVAIIVAFPHLQNLRYVSPAFGCLCLLAGVGLWHALAVARRALSATDFDALTILTAVGIATATFGDYQAFRTVFVRGDLPDMAIRTLIEFARQ